MRAYGCRWGVASNTTQIIHGSIQRRSPARLITHPVHHSRRHGQSGCCVFTTHRSERCDVAANTPQQRCCSRSHHSSGRCRMLICTANGINNHDSLVLAPLVTATVIHWTLIRDAAASAPPPTCISSEPRRKRPQTSRRPPPVVGRSCATISIAKPCQALRSRTLTGPRERI